MHEASFTDRPTAQVRFGHQGRSGTVRVYYGVTSRPSVSGFPALPGWSRERAAGVGFPTIKCEVESARPGYWSDLGWIQWVTLARPGPRAVERLVDRLPAFRSLDLPFASVGYSPTFFDAPAYNSLPAIDWRATLFLCTVPLMSRREAIAPLAGFTWGYRIAESGRPPVPRELEPAGQGSWTTLRAELTRRHPRWRFAVRFEPLRCSTSRVVPGRGRRGSDPFQRASSPPLSRSAHLAARSTPGPRSQRRH